MSVLDDILAQPAFALIRLRDSDTVLVVGGKRIDVDRLADIPGEHRDGPWDRLALVPFRQIRERGFAAHDDGTPLSVIEAERQGEIPLPELLAALPRDPVALADRGGFETSDADYAAMVREVIENDIGRGEGANLVLGRDFRARLADWGHPAALSVFRRLLERERGAYWTFCIFTGDRYLLGASPERHVSLTDSQVRMNPISGTFRMRGLETAEERRRGLLRFLRDEKEIYELFMVVDEELKMMCDICHEGGLVLGPYLKAMSHLVHTEYLLAGRTDRDARDVLRDSMFAATVTGSPVENACRLIAEHEEHGRGYYAAVAALLGHDEHGGQTVDAPILIRTADIGLDGTLRVTAGATLVRDSDPGAETAETWAKASGVLSAFGLVEDATSPAGDPDAFTTDDDVLIALGARNQRLSSFWLTDQSRAEPDPVLTGRRVVVLDNEDDFVNMLGHVLGSLGVSADVVRYDAWTSASADGYDLVIVGPGPGDPGDHDDAKIATVRRAVTDLLTAGTPFLAVCLGHQVLCELLGLPVGLKDIVFQGTQSRLPVGGREETVGFYNTFVARLPPSGLPEGVTVETDDGGDVHVLAGPHYRGIQFHAESILTHDGRGILADLIRPLLPDVPPG